MIEEKIRPDDVGDPIDGTADGSTVSETETGAASVNAVYPGASGDSSKVTDADVSDMNADSSTQGSGDDAVPGVRTG